MKKVLIVIDMQNDFIDGSLGTREAVSIVPNVKKLVSEYRECGDEIIFTRDTHGENYLDTPEGKKLPVKHCIKNTHGWQISDELIYDGMKTVDKLSFGFTEWKKRLLLHDGDEIALVGLCTDICVVSNALILKALYPNVNISVISSACAGVTPETHNAALETMKMCQIDVI